MIGDLLCKNGPVPVSLVIYQAMLSAAFGAFFAGVALLFISGRLSPRQRVGFTAVSIVAAILLEWTLLPMSDAKDPRAVLVGMLGGAFGGVVGAGIGAAIDRTRQGKGISLVLPIAALGFLLGEIATFGGNSIGKGFFEAVLPPLKHRGVADMSFEEFRAIFRRPDGSWIPEFSDLAEQEPATMDAYLRWAQKEAAAGEAEGLSGPQLFERVRTKTAIAADDLLLRADEATVSDVLALRVDMLRKLAGVDPSYCMLTLDEIALRDPAVQQVILPMGPMVMGRLLRFEGDRKKPGLPEAEFSRLSEVLLAETFNEVGDAVYLFIGEVPVTTDNRAEYCAAENDFLARINTLPGGPDGPKEEYYQTLTALNAAAP